MGGSGHPQSSFWPVCIYLKVTRREARPSWLLLAECLVGGCYVCILIERRQNTDCPPLERCERKIKLARKQRVIRWKAATTTVTGSQTKPLPLALLRGRAGPPLPMWSQHKQARIKDFKAATHKHHIQGLSETSPVMWFWARCIQTGSLAKQHGRWPCQF